MPSILPGFEYDVFISYRQNDNFSGWVTDFVKALQVEMATTIKEPVSIYYDSNPKDGLLESHNVDKSLEGKLKCLIFIPILSQTYCDPKSFAWQNEFCVFNKLSKEDQYGRDIKLSTGNVASRILPVKIHNLDIEDKAIIENEIDGVLRGIEFIYRTPGVNRPLRSNEDNPAANQNKTFYRDQINKTANAIKEIITAIKYPDRKGGASSGIWEPEADVAKVKKRPKATSPEKSIAVLPFANLSRDPSQEYFADGITENILSQLAGLQQFRVISRTSIMRFKDTTKLAREIAADLGVKYIVEGSAQMHKDKVRISVQLIDAEKDENLWSRVFVERMDDIFTLQNDVSKTVASELHSSINPVRSKESEKAPTKNLEAYDLFLKGRHAFNRWNVKGYITASDYFKKALEKDPDFREAYSYLASSYSARMSWNGDLSPKEAKPKIEKYLEEAWSRGPSENDYLTKAFVSLFIDKNFATTKEYLLKAIELNPNNADAMYTYSYLLNMMGKFEEAMQWVAKAKQIDPLTVAYFNYLTVCLYLGSRLEEAAKTAWEGLQLYPSVLRFYDFLAKIYLASEQWEEAEKVVLAGFQSSSLRPPSMVASLSSVYWALKKTEKSNELLDELLKRSEEGEKGVNTSIAYVYSAMEQWKIAGEWIEKAREANDIDLIWYEVDPILETLRLNLDKEAENTPDYEKAESNIKNMLEHEMPDLPYHNIDHINLVLSTVMVIAKEENATGEEIKMLRIAALLHDSGFIRSAKNHELHGAAIAREILPEYGFSLQQIKTIENMVMATKLPQTPDTHLERILCDADLDYLGGEDFEKEAGKLFEEFKQQGMVETEREWNLVQKTFFESHRYHTEYCKKNREANKQERYQEIVSKLKKK